MCGILCCRTLLVSRTCGILFVSWVCSILSDAPACRPVGSILSVTAACSTFCCVLGVSSAIRTTASPVPRRGLQVALLMTTSSVPRCGLREKASRCHHYIWDSDSHSEENTRGGRSASRDRLIDLSESTNLNPFIEHRLRPGHDGKLLPTVGAWT